MKTRPSQTWHGPSGTTVVELLVSVCILLVIMGVLLSVTSGSSRVVLHTTGKLEQFRSARVAYEEMTRVLGQATLNTFLDYDDPANPTRYERRSELRFLSGPMETIAGLPPAGIERPTHGVFFQAPLGTSESHGANNPQSLGNLLNTCGYFVEFGSDQLIRPGIVTTPIRYRHRLCQLLQPSNALNLYNYTSGIFPSGPNAGKPKNRFYTGKEWFTDALNRSNPPVHFLADNVVALVLLPQLPTREDPTGILLAPNYTYDSTVSNADPRINPKNQLPPLIHITTVAIDEASAKRIEQGTIMPDLGLSSLFGNASGLKADLDTLEKTLRDQRLNYRVFSSSVSIKGAKWSQDQVN